MEIKYSIESDFVTSFLDYIIIKELAPQNYGLIKDSKVFSQCVNLHPASLKLADCAGSRDRIQAFVSSNENFDPIKAKTITDCADQLLNYHTANFNQRLDRSSIFNFGITKKIETNFSNCFREANAGLI